MHAEAFPHTSPLTPLLTECTWIARQWVLWTHALYKNDIILVLRRQHVTLDDMENVSASSWWPWFLLFRDAARAGRWLDFIQFLVYEDLIFGKSEKKTFLQSSEGCHHTKAAILFDKQDEFSSFLQQNVRLRLRFRFFLMKIKSKSYKNKVKTIREYYISI